MNTAIFWRLVWKEYRQQRALWTAIALAGVMLQTAALVYCLLNGVADLPNVLFTVALSVPILYSLGCGAALFAGEHEAGTFPFQQALPVTAGHVFLAKFVFAVLSALLLFPVLWLLAFAMTSWELPSPGWHVQLWGGGVVATVEVLIWAVLGSLVLQRVLPAAVASGTIAVLLGYSSLVLVMLLGGHYQQQVGEYFSTLPLRTCFALLALAIAVKIGRQWFSENPVRWKPSTARDIRTVVSTHASAKPTNRFNMLLHLTWHEWRQGRATMLWCMFGYVAVSTWVAMGQQSGRMAYVGLLPVVATLFGASVFAGDQRRGQYQFFTEHGVGARLVWISRQLVWGFVLAVLATFATIIQLNAEPVATHELETISALVGLAWLVFACSQLCSILIRSGIVALFTAALCSVLLVIWLGFMESLRVTWLLSALSLPFIFLGASLLYAPKWIQQRHTWRVRIITAATILVPLLGVVASMAAYRVYEIPAITPSFDATVPPSDDSPAARETAAMYQQAEQILRKQLTTSNSSQAISPRDDEWHRGIGLFLAASQRETCHFPHWDDRRAELLSGSRHLFDGQQLARAVLAEAQARIEDRDPEGAAELHSGLLRLVGHFYQQHDETWYRSYGTAVEQELFSVLPEWASHELLTPETLQQTLSHLQDWSADNHPDWEASVLEHRRNVQRFIALDDEIMTDSYRLGMAEKTAIKVLGRLLPWERWRMSRLLAIYTEAELQGIREVRARGVGLPAEAARGLQWDVLLNLAGGKQQLVRSTEVDAWLGTTPWLEMTSAITAPSYVLWEKQYQVRRNAAFVQLALIAWRKEHGELPDSLTKLLGDGFESLPLDPYTNQVFLYFPNGIEEEIWDDRFLLGGMAMGGPEMMGEEMRSVEATEDNDNIVQNGMVPAEPRLVRTEPFLWSPGELLHYVPGARGVARPPIASDFRDQHARTLAEPDLLRQGLRYPIPDREQLPSDSSDNADALPTGE